MQYLPQYQYHIIICNIQYTVHLNIRIAARHCRLHGRRSAWRFVSFSRQAWRAATTSGESCNKATDATLNWCLLDGLDASWHFFGTWLDRSLACNTWNMIAKPQQNWCLNSEGRSIILRHKTECHSHSSTAPLGSSYRPHQEQRCPRSNWFCTAAPFFSKMYCKSIL